MRRLASLLLVAGGLSIAFDAAAQAPDEAETEQKVRDGLQALELGRADAVSRLEDAYAARPSPGVLYALAHAYERAGRLDDALRAYQSLASDPDATTTLRRRGRAGVDRLNPDPMVFGAPEIELPTVAEVETPDDEPFEKPSDPIVGRVALSTGLGFLGTLVGGGLGGIVAVGIIVGGNGDEGASAVGGTVGGLIALAGVAGGVSLGGVAIQGRGHFGWAYLGAVAGAGVSSAVLLAPYALGENPDGDYGVGVAAGIVVATVGTSVAFYEIFSDPFRPPSETSAGFQWAPVASPTDGGGVVGVVGSF